VSYGVGDAVDVELEGAMPGIYPGTVQLVGTEKYGGEGHYFVFLDLLRGRGGDNGKKQWWIPEGKLSPSVLQHGDPVQSPPHYNLPGGIQVIDLIRGESFLRGNALKYIFRAPHKGKELEDMRKAAEYVKWEIERLENES
jgi:hypothetical protein